VCHPHQGWPRGGEPPSCGWTKIRSRQPREEIRPTHHRNKLKVGKTPDREARARGARRRLTRSRVPFRCPRDNAGVFFLSHMPTCSFLSRHRVL